MTDDAPRFYRTAGVLYVEGYGAPRPVTLRDGSDAVARDVVPVPLGVVRNYTRSETRVQYPPSDTLPTSEDA